jgi:hypothetical protein
MTTGEGCSVTDTDAAEEIIMCLSAADGLREQIDKLVKEEDYFRWRAAQLICGQVDAGKSQRQVAQEIGRSQAFRVVRSASVATLRSDYPGAPG